jgi:hypothetical protein
MYHWRHIPALFLVSGGVSGEYFMTRVVKFGAAVVCTLSVAAAACSKKASTPSSPSAAEQVSAEANADGSTLKASAPTPQAPINGVRLEGFDPVRLVAGNSTASFVPNTPLQYRFELTNAAGAVIESTLVEGGSGTTAYAIRTTLDSEANYQWRVRPEYQGTAGPWSARAAFVSPQSKGYLRGGELYDPLMNGETIGTIVGPVTFIPGVGVRLEGFGSRIVYEMPEPVEDGELSALVTGVSTNTEGDKTKIFSMAQGYGDLTANPRRMTVEKRGDGPTGGIAWRFLTSNGDGVDTVGAERVVCQFDPSVTYFWEADWRDGFFNVRIDEGGVGGRNIYNFGKPYGGFYRPEPHVVYLGGGPARGGPFGQTVPGMIIRQVWLSQRPRPAFANK